VEMAAEGTGAIEMVNQQGIAVSVDPFNSVGHAGTGLEAHTKRFAFIFWAIVALIVALEVQLILLDWSRTFQESRWLDSTVWDGSGRPPSCSVYVFWGNCGPILSSTARNCPNGATRVYENSCKAGTARAQRFTNTHQPESRIISVTVAVDGCPCNMFNWSEFDDEDMPGNPLRSFFTTKVSDCREACSTNSACEAFVMTPPKGNKGESPNCWLKKAQRPTIRSDGATTFFKKGAVVAGRCGALVNTRGSYDADWWSGTLSVKRSDLVPRVPGKFAFEYNRRLAEFFIAHRFLRALYNTLIRNDLMFNAARELQRPIGDTTINRTPIAGRPADAPYASFNA
ncbi:hypothetical protein FRC06_011209, partial [Ceratobasidium sp. 370]